LPRTRSLTRRRTIRFSLSEWLAGRASVKRAMPTVSASLVFF